MSPRKLIIAGVALVAALAVPRSSRSRTRFYTWSG